MLNSKYDHASDAEDEADHERTAKRDNMETHVGDEDNHIPNPWGIYAPSHLEYQVYEDLSSQLEKIKMKKWTCADVEDAEAEAEKEAEANDEVNAGIDDSPEANSKYASHGQPILTLPLTEEELTQRSKKAKTANALAEDETRGKDVFWAQMGIHDEAFRVDAAGNREIHDAVAEGREYL